MQKKLNPIYLKDYRPPLFKIEQVFLHIDLFEEEARIKSVLHVSRCNQDSKGKSPLVLNGVDICLHSVTLDGRLLDEAEYTVDEQHLSIASIPHHCVLEIEVTVYPKQNKKLMGLYQSRGNFCTQCEPHGFRSITYFLDRPDVMTRFTTTITADKVRYPILLSNGNLIERKILGDRHWVRWEDPSLKPCYLFALVAGDFDCLTDEFRTRSNRCVSLRLYVEKGFADQAAYALQSLKAAMRWDEQVWGREYDLDIYMIVAVSDFNMGAMENKGLNIFNTKYVLAKPETATDQDYVNIESVIGHEYFHNWSGNRVTCRDWFQITLKEGLTVFRDQSFSIDRTSPSVARLPEVDLMRRHQFAEDASPMAHPIRPDHYIEVNNFYTLTVYRKGAEVIRMLQTLLTPVVFRKGLDFYFEHYDGQAVTTEHFIRAMETVSQRDLTQFSRWYCQVGTPVLEIEEHYHRPEEKLTITVRQSAQGGPLHLPLSIALIGTDGTEIPTQLEQEPCAVQGTRVLEVTQSNNEFTFIHVKDRPVLSLLRNFSAPVECRYAYTDEALAHLMQYDSDAFGCWNASQSFAVNVILSLAAMYSKSESMHLSDLWVSTYESLLKSPVHDSHLLSQLLTLPEEDYLLSRTRQYSIDAVHMARTAAQQQLAERLYADLIRVYDQCQSSEPYQYNVYEMGQRALKSIVLAYLVATKKPLAIKMAMKQFKSADNMTDRFGALRAINHSNVSERIEMLAIFYDDWKSDPLVVNKWLSLQAMSTLPDTLETVKTLLNHPAFNLNNPNNVYALLCAFGNNAVRFHDPSGAAYAFIAEQVLTIDQYNPQVAARVLQPLSYWRRVDEHRALLMREQLKRIADTPGISHDVYEVSVKSR